ncbi:hypothetical protein L202_08374 [Cryptococcus amylolentus CBS 6039]|uniref:Rho-GAP domain-containing protein n=1 Tax=Cryptococcus amylolentus CBS 6039 TaxID=1295533 RepID=A0A1E3HBZ7_9TREE|nr:hypothetical protein L202_08374 [Cryptococcus amylolentus CBS 6039]ODN72971.1 hypothetical protein L202_08374 [Cryptococcus amylolentus CBS 6039]
MVSTRPSPAPPKGRVAYPNAASYTPGDAGTSPAYLKPFSPIKPVTSRDSDKERAQGLKTWWKGFREKEAAEADKLAHDGRVVFGVPLEVSMQYASSQVSADGDDGALYVFGAIPVVMAKCGLYLKENATLVEGTFRVSGSAKRIRDLQTLFDTGPSYGRNIDWKKLPYTSHDVGTIFRRFLTQLPEPAISYRFYGAFRLVMERHLSQQTTFEEALEEYKNLIKALPEVHRNLLLYVLDLLSVFDRRSDTNLMNAANLALIFQPGLLSHEDHALQPRENVLSQQVLEFIITHYKRISESIEIGKPRQKSAKKKPRRKSKPTKPQRPPLVKADTDLMLPSDSDDEAPSGGYYVVEASVKKSPLPSPAPRPLPPSLAERINSERVNSPPPAAPRTVPLMDLIDPSDSDDDAPPGGYEVRTGNFAATRAALLAKSQQAELDKAASKGSTGLSRRKTVPAKVGAGLSKRRALAVREAP